MKARISTQNRLNFINKLKNLLKEFMKKRKRLSTKRK